VAQREALYVDEEEAQVAEEEALPAPRLPGRGRPLTVAEIFSASTPLF